MITRFIRIEKYAGEILDQAVDFSDQLTEEESISSGEIEVFDSAGNSVTSTLASGGASVSGFSVQYRLNAGGTPGNNYHVYVYAVLNTGEKLGQLIAMSIPKP